MTDNTHPTCNNPAQNDAAAREAVAAHDDVLGNPAAHTPGMPIVAVIGDGQLARMMHTAAIELGIS